MDRYKIIRYFAYTIEILILYMVQETPAFCRKSAGAAGAADPCGDFQSRCLRASWRGSPLAFCAACSWTSAWGAFWVSTACCWRAACYGVGLLTADLIQTNFLTSLLLAAGAVAGILFLQGYFSICSTATSTADMRWSHGTCRAWRIPSVQCRSVTHSTALWPSRSAQKRNSRRAGV